MPDYPRPYKGQNPKNKTPDEFSTWHDLSNPELEGKDRDALDALDPDRPSGAQTTSSDYTKWNPYECSPCPSCGLYASGADRCAGGNVYCQNGHSWKRVKVQESRQKSSHFGGIIGAINGGIRWMRNENSRKQ